MDTSRKYIEMCSKAVEVQEIKKEEQYFLNGDIVYYVNVDIVHVEGSIIGSRPDDKFELSNTPAHDYELSRPVWLPKQDQLQEIIKTSVTKKVMPDADNEVLAVDDLRILRVFYIYTAKFANIPVNTELTLEQMWLMFLMQVVYDKKWDENCKDWLPINY